MNIDFLLGLITGIVLCILYGHFLTERARKHQREQQKQVFDFFKQPDEMSQHIATRPSFKQRLNDALHQQLSEAIAREDFKEAARIRDLLNKK